LPRGREITLRNVSIDRRGLVLLTVVPYPLGNMGVVGGIKVCLFFRSASRIEVAEVEVDLV
jgi:hypothetical protein